MDLWFILLFLLAVSRALKILPETKLEGMLGGSIIIKCLLPKMPMRIYLCREMAKSGTCATVVSNQHFIKAEYKSRVSLKTYPDKKLFLVEMTELTESDSGVYACGAGMNTNRDKTQKVTLTVYADMPLWEVESMTESPKWFHGLPHTSWFQMLVHASSEFLPKVTTPAQRTKARKSLHPSATIPVVYRPQVSRASLRATAKTPKLPSSVTTSETSAQEMMLRTQTSSYNHLTRLHKQRAFHHGPVADMGAQGFHILIPITLGLILLALLGFMAKRVIQRRKAFHRRARRRAVRTNLLEQRPHRSQQRPQNIYSACPRRAPRIQEAGGEEVHIPETGTSQPIPPPPLQASETPWLHAPFLKANYEYTTLCYHPSAVVEDTDSDDYVNVSSLTHFSSCVTESKPWCQ